MRLCLNLLIKETFESTEKTINKLTGFHGVDLLIGIISNKTTQLLLSQNSLKNTPLIVNNVGEYALSPECQSPLLFYNSLQTYRSQWALGYWSQKQHGGTPGIFLSVYDAGYHLHEAFRLRTSAAGSVHSQLQLLQLHPEVVDASPLVEALNNTKPDYAHVILCGVDGKDFINKLNDQGLANKINLSSCSFLSEDHLTESIQEKVKDIPNASTWSKDLDTPENLEFVYTFEKYYRQKPDPFSMMGYETGIILKKSIQQLPDYASKESIQKAISGIHAKGPRGEFSLNTTKRRLIMRSV